MKGSSVETLIKRINRVEEKLYRYTEIQADIYTNVVDINKTLRIIKDGVKSMKEGIQSVKKQIRKIGFTSQK